MYKNKAGISCHLVFALGSKTSVSLHPKGDFGFGGSFCLKYNDILASGVQNRSVVINDLENPLFVALIR